jgi:hypothetical protein
MYFLKIYLKKLNKKSYITSVFIWYCDMGIF